MHVSACNAGSTAEYLEGARVSLSAFYTLMPELGKPLKVFRWHLRLLEKLVAAKQVARGTLCCAYPTRLCAQECGPACHAFVMEWVEQVLLHTRVGDTWLETICGRWVVDVCVCVCVCQHWPCQQSLMGCAYLVCQIVPSRGCEFPQVVQEICLQTRIAQQGRTLHLVLSVCAPHAVRRVPTTLVVPFA